MSRIDWLADFPQRLLLQQRFDTAILRWAPGESSDFEAAAWRDALVVVVAGALEVVCAGGWAHTFSSGDVLWLDGLPVRSLTNRGTSDTVVMRVRRRTTSNPHPASPDRSPSGNSRQLQWFLRELAQAEPHVRSGPALTPSPTDPGAALARSRAQRVTTMVRLTLDPDAVRG